MVNIAIEFIENSYGTVFAGGCVKGKVILKLDQSKSFNEISLGVVGFAKSKWSEVHSSWAGQKRTVYEGREEYINSNTFLDRPLTKGDTITLPSGTHTYSFECNIPVDCPTSFESKHGHIRYIAKVTLSCPWKFNQTHVRAFTVLKMLDLNDYWHLLLNRANKETVNRHLWGTAPQLTLNVEIPQTGYVPGEYIPVLIHLDNQSSLNIKDVRVSLILIATFISSLPREDMLVKRISLVTNKNGPFAKKSLHQLTELLRVPATLPTNKNDSRVVKIEYDVLVQANFGGLRAKVNANIPITIGIKKLRMRSEVPRVVNDRSSLDFRNSMELGSYGLYPLRLDSTISLSSSENTPPPTYEEAIYMERVDVTEGENDAESSADFLPKYPVIQSRMG